MVYTLRFFSLQNAVCFIILTCLVPILFTFYIQDVLKLKNNSDPKRLKWNDGIMQRLIFFFLQALRNCKVFYSKLSFYWKFWLETNFTFFFLLEKSEKFSRKSWKEVNFLGDVLIDWGIIVLKTICQICDVKVWTERDTATSDVSFHCSGERLCCIIRVLCLPAERQLAYLFQ